MNQCLFGGKNNGSWISLNMQYPSCDVTGKFRHCRSRRTLDSLHPRTSIHHKVTWEIIQIIGITLCNTWCECQRLELRVSKRKPTVFMPLHLIDFRIQWCNRNIQNCVNQTEYSIIFKQLKEIRWQFSVCNLITYFSPLEFVSLSNPRQIQLWDCSFHINFHLMSDKYICKSGTATN